MKHSLLPILLTTLLLGCVQPPVQEAGSAAQTTAAPRPTRNPLSATVLQNTLQCGSDLPQPTAQWLDTVPQLQQRYQQLAAQAAEPAPLPVLDFGREAVLLIGMGQRPTGGYLLNYQQQPILYDGEMLEVEVSWQEPLPGYKQAQVTTSPCLLLRLPKVAVKRVRVLDQQGLIRLESPV